MFIYFTTFASLAPHLSSRDTIQPMLVLLPLTLRAESPPFTRRHGKAIARHHAGLYVITRVTSRRSECTAPKRTRVFLNRHLYHILVAVGQTYPRLAHSFPCDYLDAQRRPQLYPNPSSSFADPAACSQLTLGKD